MKTLLRLQENVYWVGMATDTQNHCNSYDACNQAKPGVDILKIPCHVRAFQDYFTKWPTNMLPMSYCRSRRALEEREIM